MIPRYRVLELEHALGLIKGKEGGGKKLLQMSIWCVTMGASESVVSTGVKVSRCHSSCFVLQPLETGSFCVLLVETEAFN